jgi:hypothetical protein
LASGGREQELAELKRITSRISVLADSERESLDAPPKSSRAQFKGACDALGFDTCLTERRAIENYFTDRAVKAALGPKYRGLAPFERLRDCELSWSKGDNWRIARQLTIDELEGTDLLGFLDGL